MNSIKKPWGEECTWAHTPRYAAKILIIEPGQALSRQYHVTKDETLLVFSGSVSIETSTETNECKNGSVVTIPHGLTHRISNLSQTKIAILFEVSSPELDDVVRLEDNYGRV